MVDIVNNLPVTETAESIAYTDTQVQQLGDVLRAERNVLLNAEVIARNAAINNSPDSSYTEINKRDTVAPAYNIIPTELNELPSDKKEIGDVAVVHFDGITAFYEAFPWSEIDRQTNVIESGEGGNGFALAGAGNTSFFVKELVEGFWYFAAASAGITASQLEVKLSTVGSQAFFGLPNTPVFYHSAMAHHYKNYQRVYVEDAEFILLPGASLAQKQTNPTNYAGDVTKWLQVSDAN